MPLDQQIISGRPPQRGSTTELVTDFLLEVARGNINGYSSINKFGRATNIDTADGFVDIWDGVNDSNAAKTYTYSSTANIDSISSSNAGDSQDIRVLGLDSAFNEVTQTITLSGQTRVAFTTSLVRVYRMVNVGSTDIAGVVYCYVNGAITAGVPNTNADVRAIIENGNNQTLMALYTIPNGKTGYILNWYASLSKRIAAISTVKFSVRPMGEVFQLKHFADIHNTGSSHIQHSWNVPEKIEAKSDIMISVDSSANDNGVSAGFDIILIDNIR